MHTHNDLPPAPPRRITSHTRLRYVSQASNTNLLTITTILCLVTLGFLTLVLFSNEEDPMAAVFIIGPLALFSLITLGISIHNIRKVLRTWNLFLRGHATHATLVKYVHHTTRYKSSDIETHTFKYKFVDQNGTLHTSTTKTPPNIKAPPEYTHEGAYILVIFDPSNPAHTAIPGLHNISFAPHT